jgi:hypothetical protein
MSRDIPGDMSGDDRRYSRSFIADGGRQYSSTSSAFASHLGNEESLKSS